MGIFIFSAIYFCTVWIFLTSTAYFDHLKSIDFLKDSKLYIVTHGQKLKDTRQKEHIPKASY